MPAPTSGQNFAVLYDADNDLVGITADQTTAWGTTGDKTNRPGFSVLIKHSDEEEPQCLHLVASTLISSLQYGQVRVSLSSAMIHTSTPAGWVDVFPELTLRCRPDMPLLGLGSSFDE
jgi:hypothetical protein